MLNKTDPRSGTAWQSLEKIAQAVKQRRSGGSFRAQTPVANLDVLRQQVGDIYFDLSRNLLPDEALQGLLELARQSHIGEAIESLFSGDPINETEKRAVLHTALRNFSGQPVYCEGGDVMPEVIETLRKIRKFCKAVHKGDLTGYSGKKFRYVVNIGIGGSDLGPRMVTQALRPYQRDDIETYFVSNVDGSEIEAVLRKIKPERTLFLVVSKTFTTQETMRNALTAKAWFLKEARDEKHVGKHFVAVSTNESAVLEFGISRENIFRFRDWVGGRFSLWSSVGLSIALSIGFRRFEELLQGAHASDLHFRNTPAERNIPILLALVSIWHSNFLGSTSEAVIPYDQRLSLLPSYLQQAVMESNGKSIDRRGLAVEYSTSPVIWGEPGTNGQHAFFQLLHQGTQVVPCDFIGIAQPHHTFNAHHDILISHLFAQAEALMQGKTEEEVQAELSAAGLTNEQLAILLPFRIFPGGRPSNVILLKKLTPFNLGALLAFYEHKIFVQGVIWNIFSFDQWGVELGKQLANGILPQLEGEVKSGDDATTSLIRQYKLWKK